MFSIKSSLEKNTLPINFFSSAKMILFSIKSFNKNRVRPWVTMIVETYYFPVVPSCFPHIIFMGRTLCVWLNDSEETHVYLFMLEIPASTESRCIDFNFIVYIRKILEELFDFAIESKNQRRQAMVQFVSERSVRRERMKFTMSIASWLIYLPPTCPP